MTTVSCPKCTKKSRARHCKSPYCNWYMCYQCIGLPASYNILVYTPDRRYFYLGNK